MPTSADLRKAADLLESAEKIDAEIADKRTKFEASIAELVAEQERLQREADALTGVQRPTRAARSGNGRRARRGDSGADDTEIVAVVANSTEPVSRAAIAEATGIDAGKLTPRLKRLVDAGAIKKTGVKNGTRYSTG